jgi:hypothetical protein
MRSLKAIIAGCVFIIVVILFLQLAYIFIAVAYNALAKDYPILNDISGYFRYLIGIPVFITVMFIGGYITANIAGIEDRMKVLLHCMTVGLITAGGMMYPTLENSDLTITGIAVFLLALIATPAGGLYWQKDSRINQT